MRPFVVAKVRKEAQARQHIAAAAEGRTVTAKGEAARVRSREKQIRKGFRGFT
jgi:hypothetical protein